MPNFFAALKYSISSEAHVHWRAYEDVWLTVLDEFRNFFVRRDACFHKPKQSIRPASPQNPANGAARKLSL
jgi:hypothetical protein